MHKVHVMADTDETLFLRVVEAGSLRAAAEQLGTDPSTVSRRLARLEARLGVKLLQRSTRRSVATDEGALYAGGLRSLVEQQEALEARVAGARERPSGRLRITAPVDFGARFVAPVVQRLGAMAPDLEMELILGSGFVDLMEQGIDVAVRIGRLPDSRLVAKRLGMVPRVLVASPDYLKRRGEPRTPADLESHDFVLYNRANAERPIEFLGREGRQEARISGRIAVNSVTAGIALVEAGLGLHLGPLWAYLDSIEAGRVKSLLTGYRTPAYPLNAVYLKTRYVPAKIRVFLDLLAEHMGQEPALRENSVS